MSITTSMKATNSGNLSGMREPIFDINLVFWRRFDRVFVRKVACLFAAASLGRVLGHRAHSQTAQVFQVFLGQTNNGCEVTLSGSTWAATGQAVLPPCRSYFGYTDLYVTGCTADPITSGFGGCAIDSVMWGPVSGLSLYAHLVTISSKDAGAPPPVPEASIGDPISLSIANKIQSAVDYQALGPNALQFVRYYNSASIASSAGNFAQSWMHNYAAFIHAISSMAVAVARPDGKTFTFNLVGNTWTPDADVSDTLVQLTSGSTVTGWQYRVAANDSLETYDAYGNLSSIAYREGTLLTLTYATGNGAPTFPAQLLNVTDSFGRKISFGYSNNLISTMTDPNGGAYSYALSTTGGATVLSSVTYPDTYSKSYLYNESAYMGGGLYQPSALTGEIDENNSRYATTWYGSTGAAIQSQLAPGTAGNIGLYTLTNTVDGTGRIQSTSIVDPLGATRGRTFTTTVGRNLVTAVTQPAASGQSSGNRSIVYDANGNVASSADLNGNLSCSTYDLTRNLETGRVEGMAAGSTCPSSISTYVPASGTVQRKILTQYHAIWHLPIERAEPLKITTWVYNGDGGVYCAPSTAKVGSNPIGVVCSRSEQGTTDATGGAGFGATASGSPRVWSYTYNSYGQILTAKGPRTDVNQTTTYTYYSCSTGGKCGQLGDCQKFCVSSRFD